MLNDKRRFNPNGFRIIEYRAMDSCRILISTEDGIVLGYVAIMNDLGLTPLNGKQLFKGLQGAKGLR